MRDIFIVFKPGAKNGENIKPTKTTRKDKIDNSNPQKKNPKESLILTRQLILGWRFRGLIGNPQKI